MAPFQMIKVKIYENDYFFHYYHGDQIASVFDMNSNIKEVIMMAQDKTETMAIISYLIRNVEGAIPDSHLCNKCKNIYWVCDNCNTLMCKRCTKVCIYDEKYILCRACYTVNCEKCTIKDYHFYSCKKCQKHGELSFSIKPKY